MKPKQHVSRLGWRFILWKTYYKQDAYTDQLGIAHSGYEVTDEIPVVIIEERFDVPSMFGPEINNHGWKARAENGGRIFSCNWEQYPDDSMTPTYYWDCKAEGAEFWQPEDAVQAFNMKHIPHVRPDGTRAVPAGVEHCEEHDEVWYKRESGNIERGCVKCRIKEMKRAREQSQPT